MTNVANAEHGTVSLGNGHNVNIGAGTQHNYEQIGGSQNRQYNATYQTFNNYAAAQLAKPPPVPLSTIPYEQNPDYIDRDELVQALAEKASVARSRTALIGLGGVGKTQLVMQYATQIRNTSPDTWVLWLHASNADRFEESLRYVADQIQLDGRTDAGANLYHLFHSWLGDRRNGKWLLILDNLDDSTFMLNAPVHATSQSSRRVLDYLPFAEHGTIVVTSRARSEVLKLGLFESNILAVHTMDEFHACALLQKKLGTDIDEDVCKLAEALDYLPLALAQAAAYIRSSVSIQSISQYLRQLQASRQSRTSLLKEDSLMAGRDREAVSSVMLTWQLSFDHIRSHQDSAADLLSIMSFCDCHSIPDMLIKAYHKINIDDAKTAGAAFEADLKILREFSFITRTSDGQGWDMHRLVQDATQRWLYDMNELAKKKHDFVLALLKVFPIPQYQTWQTTQILWPHVKAAMALAPIEKPAARDWAHLMYRSQFAWTTLYNITEIKRFSKLTYITRVEVLGPEHPETLLSMEHLAWAYRESYQYTSAEKLLSGLVKVQSKIYGEHHADTLLNRSELACLYEVQHRYDEAYLLQQEVLDLCLSEIGPEHAVTLFGIGNLARIQARRGQLEEAEYLLMSLVETRLRLLGQKHQDTLTAQGFLARCLSIQGKWKNAETLTETVVKAVQELVGADHPDTIRYQVDLASCYIGTNRLSDAKELLLQLVKKCERVLGVSHRSTILSHRHLAQVYHKDKDDFEAEKRLLILLEVSKEGKNMDTETLSSTLTLLSRIYRHAGHDEEADEMSWIRQEAELLDVENRQVFLARQTFRRILQPQATESVSTEPLGQTERSVADEPRKKTVPTHGNMPTSVENRAPEIDHPTHPVMKDSLPLDIPPKRQDSEINDIVNSIQKVEFDADVYKSSWTNPLVQRSAQGSLLQRFRSKKIFRKG